MPLLRWDGLALRLGRDDPTVTAYDEACDALSRSYVAVARLRPDAADDDLRPVFAELLDAGASFDASYARFLDEAHRRAAIEDPPSRR